MRRERARMRERGGSSRPRPSLMAAAMFRSLLVSAAQQRPQAPGGAPREQPPGAPDALEAQFSCPICLEVYHRAVCIGGCGHTFCGECLQPCLQVPSPLCPLCRMPFDPKKVEKASNVEKQLSSYKAPCRGCSKKVTLAKMRSHVSSCTKVQEQMANCPKFVPVVPTSQPIPRVYCNLLFCRLGEMQKVNCVAGKVAIFQTGPRLSALTVEPGTWTSRSWSSTAWRTTATTPTKWCAQSVRRCPGETPATRAPTSCSISYTGTSSPMTPLWTIISTRKQHCRLRWRSPSRRTEGDCQAAVWILCTGRLSAGRGVLKLFPLEGVKHGQVQQLFPKC